jgi:hypothetical protein
MLRVEFEAMLYLLLIHCLALIMRISTLLSLVNVSLASNSEAGLPALSSEIHNLSRRIADETAALRDDQSNFAIHRGILVDFSDQCTRWALGIRRLASVVQCDPTNVGFFHSELRRSLTNPWLRFANRDKILTTAELRNWSLGIESAYDQLKQGLMDRINSPEVCPYTQGMLLALDPIIRYEEDTRDVRDHPQIISRKTIIQGLEQELETAQKSFASIVLGGAAPK